MVSSAGKHPQILCPQIKQHLEDELKRKLAVITVAAATAGLALTGCSSDSANAFKCAPEGSASNAVKVSGKRGETQTVKIDGDLKTTEQQVTVVDKGDGEQIKSAEGSNYNINAFLYKADGSELLSNPGLAVDFGSASLPEWIKNVAGCVTDSGRAVSVLPAGEIFADPNSAGFTDLQATDPIIAVIDFQGASKAAPGELADDKLLPQAKGEAKELPEGFPTVEVAESGEPTITFPEGLAQPTELTKELLVAGDGEEVKDGDRVYVHYKGVIWRTGEEFDSSWSRGTAANFTTDGVIEGFRYALVGEKVGSRVVVAVPADAGYGAEQLQVQGHQGDDVMLFVLDILGTVHPE